jgi:hypothetical protein
MKPCSRRSARLTHRRSTVTGGPSRCSRGVGCKPGQGLFEEARPETACDILAELAWLAWLGETRTWRPGATVVAEGDVADCRYLIREGELRV